jgi:acyl-coenzyme A synthetase/AMP-(fatty) acid ligase
MNTAFAPEWVSHHADRSPDAPAIATAETRLSYAELADRSAALGAHLAAAGVVAGDRVLVALPNVVASVVADLAVQSLGACVVSLGRAWRGDSLGQIVARTGARHAFVDARALGLWRDIAPRHELRLWIVESPAAPRGVGVGQLGAFIAGALCEDGTVRSGSEPDRPRPYPHRPNDPAVILYTSGSTGEPRGVIQTWRNISANTRAIARYLDLGPADRAMLVLPLSYCYGRSVLQTHLFAGASVFMDDRFMYPRVVLEAIAEEACTGFAGVPATFELIKGQVDMSSLGPLPSLRYVTQAGGAMSPETIAWTRRAFSPARLFVMYGQTEATARLSYLPPEHAEDKEGSIGIPVDGVELRVLDAAGAPAAPGVVGDLVARGASVTPGYLDDPIETARILHDGWLWTGDLAWHDEDGFFFHAGRTKDILKIAGHRVSPIEIELALQRHPDVAQVAVIGAGQDLAGDVARAYVVRRPGSELSDEILRRFCVDQLPPFKVPKTISFVETLPRSDSGKLLRSRIADPEPVASVT